MAVTAPAPASTRRLNPQVVFGRLDRGEITSAQAAALLKRPRTPSQTPSLSVTERTALRRQRGVSGPARRRTPSTPSATRRRAPTVPTKKRQTAPQIFRRLDRGDITIAESKRLLAINKARGVRPKPAVSGPPPKRPKPAVSGPPPKRPKPVQRTTVLQTQQAARAEALKRLKPFTSTGGVDLGRAEAAIGGRILQDAGFTVREIRAAAQRETTRKGLQKQIDVQNVAVKKLDRFTDSQGQFDLVKARIAGVSDSDLRAAGFNDKARKQAFDGAFALNRLRPFTDKQGNVDLTGALDAPGNRGLNKKNLQAVGFTDSQIDNAFESTPKRGDFKKKAGGIALDLIPVYGTYRTWERSSNLQRSINIASDVLTIVPIAGGAAAGVRAGSKILPAITKSVVAEAIAPISAIRHPIKTIRTAVDPIEIALRPSRIPLSATSIREHTIRFPLKEIGKLGADTTDAKLAVSGATLDAIRTGKGRAAIGTTGEEFRISPTVLRKVSSEPIAIHATPDIRPFMQGLTVSKGREGGLFFSPSLHTRFTHSTAFGDVPTGGVPGAIIIRDVKITSKLKGSDKTFRGTVEVEAVLKAGERLPPPSQYLMVRDAAGSKIQLAIIGKPFTKSEVLRLKFFGSIESVTQILKDPIRLSKGRQGKALAKAYDDELIIRNEIIDLRRKIKGRTKRGDKTKVELRQDLQRAQADLRAANRRTATAATRRYEGTVLAAYRGQQDIGKALREAGTKGTIRSDRTTPTPSRVRRTVTARRKAPSPTRLTRAPAAAAREATRAKGDRATTARAPSRGLTSRTTGRVPTTGRTPTRVPSGRTPTRVPTDRVPSRTPTTGRVPGRVPVTRVEGRVPPLPRVVGKPPIFPRRGPRTPTPRFKLPDGTKLKRGIFPRIVRWRQGAFNITLDIDSGRKFFRRSKPGEPKLTPAKSFDVLTKDKTKPKERTFRQGSVLIDVTTTSLSFRGIKQKRGL